MAIYIENDRIFSVCATGDTVIRHEMEKELKEAFREIALKKRYDCELTQAKMAAALAMSERSYEDIENGHSSCGALTIVLLLMQMVNRDEFLSNLRNKLENAYRLEPASV